jgi:hypothetical protein
MSDLIWTIIITAVIVVTLFISVAILLDNIDNL